MSWQAPRRDPRCFKKGEILQLALAEIVPGREHLDFVHLMTECTVFTKALHDLKPKIAASGLTFRHLDPDFDDESLWPPFFVLRPHSDALCRTWLLDGSVALPETSKILTLEQLKVELKLNLS